MAYGNTGRRQQQNANRKIDLWKLQETVKNQARIIAHLSRSNAALSNLVDVLREEVADLAELVAQPPKPWWERLFNR
ncbi:hypothetical protein ACTUM7_01275 [Basfia succiniciproducens]|uniref:hypothetical protein n=1 Tax=Basfia succiniciproducens TaxID=653940 RepID=UPI003FCD23E9